MKKLNVQEAKIKRWIGDVLNSKEIKIIAKSIPKMKLGERRFFIQNYERTVSLTYSKVPKVKAFTNYPNLDKHIVLFIKQNGTTDIYSIDPKFLEKSFNVNHPNNCLVYCHNSCLSNDNTNTQYNYHGFTSRTMPIRLKEHLKADSNFGNRYRLIRNYGNVINFHYIVADGLTKHDALNLEEKVIDSNSLFRDNKGNNMIPGGYTGLRIAKKLGYSDREKAEIDLEKASSDSNKLNEICSRVHNWELNNDQISNIVCNNKNNFTKDEVNFIRLCSLQLEKVVDIKRLLIAKFNRHNKVDTYLLDRIKGIINGFSYRFVT